MIEIKEEEELSNKILRAYKPKLFLPVWTTLICSGPPLNLLLDTSVFSDTKKAAIGILLTIVGVAWVSVLWFRYIKGRRVFIELKKEIPIVIHYLFSKDEASLENMAELEEIVNAKSITEVLKNIRKMMDNDN